MKMRMAFTLYEVAELVGVSLRTIRREVDRGNLNVARVGERRVRVSAPELARWWKEKGGGELWLTGHPFTTIGTVSMAIQQVEEWKDNPQLSSVLKSMGTTGLLNQMVKQAEQEEEES